jgi:monooxygenase
MLRANEAAAGGGLREPQLTDVDVLIIGAGLSGIGTACYLRQHCPDKTFMLLEARDAVGGTWDLFRYPGVRSDSDMYTLGYSFRPWRGTKALADGPSILSYIRQTAEAFDIIRHIRFGQRAVKATWSSATALWSVAIEADGGTAQLTCGHLHMCSGYYNYAQGHNPNWPGMEQFKGTILHPQKWPEDQSYDGARVVVIGSGATAVTLVPAMAERAGHVTMLQRSPTYIVSRPAVDPIATALNRYLPAKLAYWLARWKNILLQRYFYATARRKPDAVRRLILGGVRAELGPDYDLRKHFNPRYDPWDQRLCLVPDGDLFAAIRQGKAEIVTDEIERFTEQGIRLRSGVELAADIIVTATGLDLQFMGGMALVVDGAEISLAEALSYKGVMYSGVPNLTAAFGYTNASWTLKCDLISGYLCRLLRFMDARGYAICQPERGDAAASAETTLPLSSGYVQRAQHRLPKQGQTWPWRSHQNYIKDLLAFRFGALDDGTLVFRK